MPDRTCAAKDIDWKLAGINLSFLFEKHQFGFGVREFRCSGYRKWNLCGLSCFPLLMTSRVLKERHSDIEERLFIGGSSSLRAWVGDSDGWLGILVSGAVFVGLELRMDLAVAFRGST